MPTLFAVLQHGFEDDEVRIHVNGEERFVDAHVTSNLLRGYAKSFVIEVPAGEVTLKVDVPTRNLAQTCHYQIETTLYVGIMIAWDGRSIECTSSDKPFATI